MKKITAFLLALVMALSLAACGSKDDSKQLVGTWQCALDLTEKMDEEMAANLGTEYTSEVPVSLYLTTVFNEDGTFSMSPDLDATTESLNAYIQALKPALVELLYKEAEDRGMTRDEFDSALADSGLTVESQVDSVLALFDVSTLLSDVESELDSGKYKLEDGRLYLAAASPRPIPLAVPSAAVPCSGPTIRALWPIWRRSWAYPPICPGQSSKPVYTKRDNISIDAYFPDLTPMARRRLLKAQEFSCAENGDYDPDIVPLFL